MQARHIGRIVLALCGLLAPFGALAQKPDASRIVRKIDLGEYRRAPRGPFPGKPTVIASAADLDRAFSEEEDADLRERIRKQTDFKTERLLFFAWSGSGQDRLTPEIQPDKPLVLFVYQPGRTRDLRPHAHLFALSRRAAYDVKARTFGAAAR